MSQQNHRQREIERVIASGKALAREAHLLLERSRHQMRLMGIDPERELELLRQEIGDEGLARAEAEALALVNAMDAEIKRDAMHARPLGGSGRHARLRSNRV